MKLFLTGLLAFAVFSPALAQTEILSGRVLGGEDVIEFGGLRNAQNTDSRDEVLSDTARRLLEELFTSPPNRTASILRDIARLQDSLTRMNELEEAVAIRNSVREFLAQQEGVQPDPGNLSAFRGQNGRKLEFFVTGRRQGSVWGTGLYTDDSALGSAVVHAGLLADGESGIVRVTLKPGQAEYQGTERNGVLSQSYGSFGGSYTVALVAKTNRSKAIPDKQQSEPESFLPKAAQEILAEVKESENRKEFKRVLGRGVRRLLEMQRASARAGKLDEALAIKDAAFELLVILYEAVPVPGSFTEYREWVGQSGYFVLKGSKAGSVWGSGTYTDDSAPGAAAVHAGLLRPGQKGILKVTILPGMEAYSGSSQNGVTSNSYETWQGSYRLETIPDR